MTTIDRRSFIKTAGLGTSLIGLSGSVSALGLSSPAQNKNKLPRWRGFNLLDFYTSKPLVLADGNNGGSSVTPELNGLKVAQSCRGYFPGEISHYRAPWVWKNPDDAPTPVWPGTIKNKAFSRKTLEDFYRPWIELVQQGVGVHCGECGCYKETPHEVFLAWMTDVLDILTENKIGWAFWNFRGDFGVMNSGRKDVAYEDWYGQKLDRKMLEMLQKH